MKFHMRQKGGMTAYCYASARELAKLIAKKQLSPVELMEATFERLTSVNGKINAFIALQPEKAMTEAGPLTRTVTDTSLG